MSSFKRFYLIACFYCIANLCPAQTLSGFEWGVTAGSVFHTGNANSYITRQPGPAAGTFFRWNTNPRLATKTHLQYGNITVNDMRIHMTDVVVHLEYAFFSYRTHRYTEGRKYSPYLLSGISVTFFNPGIYRLAELNVPFGIGMKYKIHENFNLGLELSFKKFVTSGTGSLKNKDWYTFLIITISRDYVFRRQNCNIVYY